LFENVFISGPGRGREIEIFIGLRQRKQEEAKENCIMKYLIFVIFIEY
jgi:hypothetical protein